MVGVILVGLVAYRQLPVSALPQVGLPPQFRWQTFLSRRKPGRDGLFGHGAP